MLSRGSVTRDCWRHFSDSDTFSFKVLTVAHKLERQHLEAAFLKRKKEDFVVHAIVEADPDNTFDANVICVLMTMEVDFNMLA